MSRQDRHEHDRALELAASAIDYGLTAAQSAALDTHLATCPACARSAAAMRGDAIALHPRTTLLPSRRVDDAVSAAIAGRRAASPSLLVLVAAVLLLIALLGVGAAVGSVLLRTWWTPAPIVVVDASPSTGPTDLVADAPDARFSHTATRLPDGRVLMAGGYNGLDRFATAEIYDPATATFSPTGSMATYRISHTATLFPDGRILMAGGSDDSSAEIYDPKTGTFSPTGAMTDVRSGHTATLLPDGRVLIVGGSTHAESYSAVSAEIYDPRTGTFSPTGAMATARIGHTATLLPDGRVLVTGGSNGTEGAVPTSEIVATAELYDPRTGTFSPTGSMVDARTAHTATLLPDGRVLVAGGATQRVAGQHDANDPAEVVASAEIYDPTTGTFSPTGSMATGRSVHTATLLPDGRVLVAGGSDDSEVFASAEIYDPRTGTFSPTGAMATAHFPHTATLLGDGRVLLAGGSEVFASVQIYDPATGIFSPTKP